MEKQGFVYIMGNNRPTLYVGVTADLCRRVYQHREGLVEGFTKNYHLDKLLYFEVFDSIEEAIEREKQLKNWRREWKLALIRKNNPEFKDLYQELTGSAVSSSCRKRHSNRIVILTEASS